MLFDFKFSAYVSNRHAKLYLDEVNEFIQCKYLKYIDAGDYIWTSIHVSIRYLQLYVNIPMATYRVL